MTILGLGLDFQGRRIFSSVGEDGVRNELLAALQRNWDDIQRLSSGTSRAVTFRGEIERRSLDPGDPRSAGWAFLLNEADPNRAAYEAALAPLAQRRGMSPPQRPLLYSRGGADEWFDWLEDNYYSLELEGRKAPQYIVIVGGPDQVPFSFQSLLTTVAKVGRVDFDETADLERYVEKLIRLETAAEPMVSRDAVLFAPDGGIEDPTYFSRRYMVEPIADYLTGKLGFPARMMVGEHATKTALSEALAEGCPALVYTASHGLGATEESLEVQKRYNGAICCQHAGPPTANSLFSADDVPASDPFLEGSIFFQFACFGYGTPAVSDYAHWLSGVPKRYAEADFVASLPKRLLANPRGPIAFIGHLDTAFLHGFAEASAPHALDGWHNRIEPFVKAISSLLDQTQPTGYAMQDMASRYNICNARLTYTYDRQRRGRIHWTEQLMARFLDTWITRSDAQNYMIFGDPAARLRIPVD